MFLAALHSLAEKLMFADADPRAQASAALRDVAPELEKLRAKAAVKCRDFLLQRIYSLRKDKTNIQVCCWCFACAGMLFVLFVLFVFVLFVFVLFVFVLVLVLFVTIISQ